MTPGAWTAVVLVLLAVIILCLILLDLDAAQPPRTNAEMDADAKAMLKAANQEVTDRPRIRAGTEPLLHRERNL
jgi:hypothetical protein